MSDRQGDRVDVVGTLLPFVQIGQFLIVEFAPPAGSDEPPYVQAARDPSGWYLEVVSEFYLPRDVWPIDELALRRRGWIAPVDVDQNWWQRVEDPASLDDVARRLVDGLVAGRCCAGEGELNVSIGTFPSGPDGGLPLPSLADAA